MRKVHAQLPPFDPPADGKIGGLFGPRWGENGVLGNLFLPAHQDGWFSLPFGGYSHARLFSLFSAVLKGVVFYLSASECMSCSPRGFLPSPFFRDRGKRFAEILANDEWSPHLWQVSLPSPPFFPRGFSFSLLSSQLRKQLSKVFSQIGRVRRKMRNSPLPPREPVEACLLLKLALYSFLKERVIGPFLSLASKVGALRETPVLSPLPFYSSDWRRKRALVDSSLLRLAE